MEEEKMHYSSTGKRCNNCKKHNQVGFVGTEPKKHSFKQRMHCACGRTFIATFPPTTPDANRFRGHTYAQTWIDEGVFPEISSYPFYPLT